MTTDQPNETWFWELPTKDPDAASVSRVYAPPQEQRFIDPNTGEAWVYRLGIRGAPYRAMVF